RYVELPFRDRTRTNRRTIFASALLMSVIMIGIGTAGYSSQGFPKRIPASVYDAVYPAKSNEDAVCKWQPVDSRYASIVVCEFGDLKATESVALYGDSHASALFSAVDREFKEKGIRGLRIKKLVCQDIPEIVMDKADSKPTVAFAEECMEAHKAFTDY